MEKTPQSPTQNTDILLALENFGNSLYLKIQSLITPWALIQYVLIALCIAGGFVLSHFLVPRLEPYLARITFAPLKKALTLLLGRLKWIAAALLIWLAALIITTFSWPSHSYFLRLAGELVTAWIIISTISRFISNRTYAKTLGLIAWGVVSLHIVGIFAPLIKTLDSVAFSAGSSRISLLSSVQAILLCGLLLWIAAILANFIERQLKNNSDLTPSLQVLIGKIIKIALLAAALMVSLSTVGIDLTALTIFSGAIGLGLGFGLQKVVSNLISGIIILLDKSIKPGDVISLGERFGWITSLKARYVSVVTRDGVEFLIPNEDFITEQVVNWSYSNRNVRLDVTFGVDYTENPHQVRKLAVDAVEKLERVISAPSPVCHMTAFGESSLDFILRFWIRDPEAGLTNIRGQVFLALWDTFQEHNITVPYPHREIVIHQAPAQTPPQPSK